MIRSESQLLGPFQITAKSVTLTEKQKMVSKLEKVAEELRGEINVNRTKVLDKKNMLKGELDLIIASVTTCYL